MTGHYDPDGSLIEYRREMERREMHRTIVWAVITVVVCILILAAIDITLSIYGK
jgi:roadblock/LC7 domain-containing protein